MTLTLSELTRIADDVARDEDTALTVVTVASSDAETGRVELLVTVAGCHPEPCTLLLNLSRGERARFEGELRSELRAALDRHRQSTSS